MSQYNRGPGVLSRLNSREKLLLLLMVLIFGSMFLFIFGKKFLSGSGDAEAQLEQYENALELLSLRQDDFIENVREREELQAQLENNELQLRTFLEQECGATNVAVPSNYNDSVIPQRDPNSGEASYVEYETVATIPSVEPVNLSRLLHRIANSEHLILIKAIDIRPARRGGGGRYEVRLTVSTYRLATDS